MLRLLNLKGNRNFYVQLMRRFIRQNDGAKALVIYQQVFGHKGFVRDAYVYALAMQVIFKQIHFFLNFFFNSFFFVVAAGTSFVERLRWRP